MSRYVRKSLSDGEEIVVKARKSWWYITWPSLCLACAVFAIIFATPQIAKLADTVTSGVPFIDKMLPTIFTYVLPALLGVVLGLATFIPFYRHLITFLTLQVVLTNKRLISKVGLFRIRALDIPVDKIDHIEVRSSLIGNLLHNFDVEIASVSGTDGVVQRGKKTVRTFCGIANARKLRDAVQEIVEKHADEHRKLQAKEIANAMRSY